ncbi:hypothetical protein D9M68_1000650 [compost metagenome]
MGRIDLIDRRFGRRLLIVVEIVGIGEGGIGPARFPMLDRGERARGLDSPAPIAVPDFGAKGAGIPLIDA